MKILGDIIELKNSKYFQNSFPKEIRNLGLKKLLFLGKTTSDPEYYVLLYYNINEKINLSYDTYTIASITKEIDKKKFSLILMSLKKMNYPETLNKDGVQMINSLSSLNEIPFTFQEFFMEMKDETNILRFDNKLNSLKIETNPKKSFNDFQLLASYYSTTPNSNFYKSLIELYNVRRKKISDSLIPIINNNQVDINSLFLNNKVIMLNENHWLPEHRIMATKLLPLLEKNGFKDIAIEAIDIDKIDRLNQRKFPLITDGYYLREPFFGHFIRKIFQLNINIHAYDENSENRELKQSVNLFDIIKSNTSNTKLFVYAGFDHIYEKSIKDKRMAEIFYEKYNVNPITIDQNSYISSQELIKNSIFPSNVIDTLKKVDFFMLNNLKPCLEELFDSITNYTFYNEKLKKFDGKELFISIYYKEEFEKYKTLCVPYSNFIFKIENDKIIFPISKGNFIIRIEDSEKHKIVEENIIID